MNSTVGRSVIQKLSSAVANSIAAGEVVERPSAVIKELMENALDAGAKNIIVVIVDAGRTLMQVIDDGSGMSETDMQASVQRHSTSKLSQFADLESLQTFGFRGEALPSVAAVSRLVMTSCLKDNELAIRMKISAGEIDSISPVSAAPGTSISVSHLFYNVPARRKFLKSDSTEFKWIASVFRQFAIAFPAVGFKLTHGKNTMYDLAASTQLERLASLFGDDIAEDMIEINHQRSWLTVKGFITPPSLTLRHKNDQYLFLNRRPITNNRLNHAIYTACEPYFISGGHPIYAVFLEASPERFDINVHPAKKEIKFADESVAYSGLWSAIRSSITGARLSSESVNAIAPGSQKLTEQVAEIANVQSPPHLKPYTPIPRHYSGPARDPLPFPPSRGQSGLTPIADGTGESISPSSDKLTEEGESYSLSKSNDEPEVWQVMNTFIISPLKTGLVFIDQHIAHERILYEKALSAMEKEPFPSQQLLFPSTFSVQPEDVKLIEEILPLIAAMGFSVTAFGPREFRISSVPVGFKIGDEKALLLGILDEYQQITGVQSDPRQNLAAAFSCKAAIKAGQALNEIEMRKLIDDLFQSDDPEFCPHGRPIYHVLSQKEIEKWFKRG